MHKSADLQNKQLRADMQHFKAAFSILNTYIIESVANVLFSATEYADSRNTSEHFC